MAHSSASTITVLRDFDEAPLSPDLWNELLQEGATPSVFMTHEWQRAWWDTFGRGQLLLVLAHCDRPVALAPLFGDEDGMVYFIGSGGSDYLDFLGDVSDPGVLAALLAAAADSVPSFAGFRFFHVPASSSTARVLQTAAEILGFAWVEEGSQIAPELEFESYPDAAEKKRLVYYENYFRRRASLEVLHLQDAGEIYPHLDAFFAQHIERWSITEHPSLFLNPRERLFYQTLTQCGGSAGWLRFTRVACDGMPIAFHFGFSYQGRFLMYKPTFALEMARRSPGQVLLRQLLLAAIAERVPVFDFGLGDEGYKRRFATQVSVVLNFGIYPIH
jgi:CelD/BcsL family acetyltransferase involved in cellulose biosynthesis